MTDLDRTLSAIFGPKEPIVTASPADVMRARRNRLVAAGSTPAATFTSAGRVVPVALIAPERVSREDEGDQRRPYTQQSTGAVLTVGDLEDRIEWEHNGHEATLLTYALVEKPKRVMVTCVTCMARWDEKR